MRPYKFTLIFGAMLVLDGCMTAFLGAQMAMGPMVASSVAAAISYAALACVLSRVFQADRSGLASTLFISVISLGVSLAIFGLILARNPLIQWPVAFTAASLAALAFAAFGYARAAKATQFRL